MTQPSPPSSEHEIKIPVADLAPVRRRLEAAGAARCGARERETNTLFDDSAGRLAAAGCVLRLRRAGERSILTWKGRAAFSGGVKSREEVETEVGSPRAATKILEALGFSPAFRYEKFREEFDLGGCRICLDETPIGFFVEVEGPPASIVPVVESIGLDVSAAVALSYPGLYRAARGLDPSLPEDMLLPE